MPVGCGKEDGIKMKRIVLLLALLILSAGAAAQQWSDDFSVAHAMGDGDTRASARQAALEQLKLKASHAVGSYIQSTITLRSDGALEESIDMLSASMVKLSDIDDMLAVDESGRAVLTVRAKALVDEGQLLQRVKALQEDQEKARQLKVLQAENEALRRDLTKIRHELASSKDTARAAQLLEEQDTAMKRIRENERTVSQVFERGTLLQLATRNADEFEQVKAELERKLFRPLLASPVTATIETVEAAEDGYIVFVRVGWRPDLQAVESVLSRYLKIRVRSTRTASSVLYASRYRNSQGHGPHVLTERVYNYLLMEGVDLVVSLAGREVRVPVFYSENGFRICERRPDKVRAGASKTLCLISHPASEPDFHGVPFSKDLANPLKIRLTQNEAERATRVEARLVRVRE